MPVPDRICQDEQHVRPYAVTGGRTQSRHVMHLATQIIARTSPTPGAWGPEAEEVVALCQQPRSVAEIAGRLHQPAQVIKILVSDLIDSSDVALPPTSDTPTHPHRDVQLLEAVLAGLHSLHPTAA